MHPFQPLVQNWFFIEISRNLRSWDFNPLSLALLAFTCGAILTVIVGSLVYNRFCRTASRSGNGFAILNPKDIRTLLDRAFTERVKIEFSFEPIEGPHRATACTITDLTDDGLTVELPDYLDAKPEWQNRPVYLFFGLESDQKAMVFYTCATTVANFHRESSGRLYCHLPMPDRLDMRQKRRHLRLEPPSQLVGRMSVWHAVFVKGYAMEEDLRKWGPPLFTISPEGGDKVLLVNLSAGGLRLKIFQSVRHRAQFDPEKNRNLFLQIDLYDPEGQKNRRFWFYGTLRNFFEDYTTRDLEIGLHFVGLGLPNPEMPAGIKWQKIDPEVGVVDLENWVVKRYMELYRKKGLI